MRLWVNPKSPIDANPMCSGHRLDAPRPCEDDHVVAFRRKDDVRSHLGTQYDVGCNLGLFHERSGLPRKSRVNAFPPIGLCLCPHHFCDDPRRNKLVLVRKHLSAEPLDVEHLLDRAPVVVVVVDRSGFDERLSFVVGLDEDGRVTAALLALET